MSLSCRPASIFAALSSLDSACQADGQRLLVGEIRISGLTPRPFSSALLRSAFDRRFIRLASANLDQLIAGQGEKEFAFIAGPRLSAARRTREIKLPLPAFGFRPGFFSAGRR
jgi:hypothetical protein